MYKSIFILFLFIFGGFKVNSQDNKLPNLREITPTIPDSIDGYCKGRLLGGAFQIKQFLGYRSLINLEQFLKRDNPISFILSCIDYVGESGSNYQIYILTKDSLCISYDVIFKFRLNKIKIVKRIVEDRNKYLKVLSYFNYRNICYRATTDESVGWLLYLVMVEGKYKLKKDLIRIY